MNKRIIKDPEELVDAIDEGLNTLNRELYFLQDFGMIDGTARNKIEKKLKWMIALTRTLDEELNYEANGCNCKEER